MAIESIIKEFFQDKGYQVMKVDNTIEGDLILRMTKGNKEYLGRYFRGSATSQDVQRLLDDLRQSRSEGIAFAFNGFSYGAKELIKQYDLISFTKKDLSSTQKNQIDMLVGFP